MEDNNREVMEAKKMIENHVKSTAEAIMRLLVEGECALYFNPDMGSIIVLMDGKTSSDFKAQKPEAEQVFKNFIANVHAFIGQFVRQQPKIIKPGS